MKKILATIVLLLSATITYSQVDKSCVKFGYFFPEEVGMKYENSVALQWSVQGGKYVTDNIFVKSGIGWMPYSWGYGLAMDRYEIDTHTLNIPLLAGYTLRLSDNLGLDIDMGPSLNYIIAGKITDNGNITKYKDLDVDRTSVTFIAEIALNIFGFQIGFDGHFGEDSYEMWGITFGIGF